MYDETATKPEGIGLAEPPLQTELQTRDDQSGGGVAAATLRCQVTDVAASLRSGWRLGNPAR